MATKTEKILKIEGELDNLNSELVKYKKLYAEDGTIDQDEQKQLNIMQSQIQAIQLKIKTMYEDPIKEKVGTYIEGKWVDYFSLETWVHYECSDRNTNKKTGKFSGKIELEKINEVLDFPANSKINLNIWARAFVVNEGEWYGVDYEEYVEKKIGVSILVGADRQIETHEMLYNDLSKHGGENKYDAIDLNISVDVISKMNCVKVKGQIVLPAREISSQHTSGKHNVELGGELEKEGVGNGGGNYSYEGGQTERSTTYSFKEVKLTPIDCTLGFNIVDPITVMVGGGISTDSEVTEVHFEKIGQVNFTDNSKTTLMKWWIRIEEVRKEDFAFMNAIENGEFTVWIWGCADRKGTPSQNFAIGKSRAETAKNFLVDNVAHFEGMGSKFKLGSYGEAKTDGEDDTANYDARKVIVRITTKFETKSYPSTLKRRR